ncbi:hypothetical protein MMC10_004717 [Thelotrema lepadinum]|nr:hypothetical protein [Thelotrema lepadinum]
MRPSLLLSLAPLAAAQSYLFPIVTKTVASAVISQINSDVASYSTSVAGSPAYTSAVLELEQQCDCDDPDDPLALAGVLLTATATPSWYTELPGDLQTFVHSVAAAEASIAQKDSGAGSIRPTAGGLEGVWMYGVVVGAVFVGAMIL